MKPAATHEPTMSDALVIGYGSTLRRDDAVGFRVAEALAEERIGGVQVLARHQLTPELADPIARARLVVFADASLQLPDRQIRLRPVTPAGAPQISIHTARPEGLLHLAESVFGARPPAWLCEIPIADTGIGESLSPLAEQGIAQAVAAIRRLVESSAS